MMWQVPGSGTSKLMAAAYQRSPFGEGTVLTNASAAARRPYITALPSHGGDQLNAVRVAGGSPSAKSTATLAQTGMLTVGPSTPSICQYMRGLLPGAPSTTRVVWPLAARRQAAWTSVWRDYSNSSIERHPGSTHNQRLAHLCQ